MEVIVKRKEMRLYRVRSSKGFLLERWTLYESIRETNMIWYVCEWMKVKFERDLARILCDEHNIRPESCDCEYWAVLDEKHI